LSDHPPDDGRRYAPATQRNREPILAVLKRVLPENGSLLEVAAGTGEHAVFFARAFPKLVWQPSDPDPANLTSINVWAEREGTENLKPAIGIDVLNPPEGLRSFSAGLCINMIHIAPWAATAALFKLWSECLISGAPAVLYGPFHMAGIPTAPSNADFDQSLRARDSAWGIRDLEAVIQTAGAAGFIHAETIAMPANNQTVIFRRRGA